MREYNLGMFVAWHTSALARAKKMPKLDRLMMKTPMSRGKQTWQEQLRIMDAYMERLNATAKQVN